jgi:dCMP deaminase
MDDIALMKMAYELAKDSKDPSTQNGAILVAEGGTEPLAIGINEFPLNVEDKPERWDRPLKYEYIEHAEKNVIFDAAWRGVATEGLIMYCCWAACTSCARAIIQTGVKKLVRHQIPGLPNHNHWSENIEIALQMLREAHVDVFTMTEKLYPGNSFMIRRNGELVSP